MSAVPLLSLLAALAAPDGPPAAVPPDATVAEATAYFLAGRDPLIPAAEAAFAGGDAAAQLAALSAIRDAEVAGLAAARSGLEPTDSRRAAVVEALREESGGSFATLAELRETAGEGEAAEAELRTFAALTGSIYGAGDWRTADAVRAADHQRDRRGLPAGARARLAEAGREYLAQMSARRAGRYDEAAAHARERAAIRAEVLGPRHPDTAAAWDALGGLLMRTGDFAGARESLARAAEVRREVLGPRHPDTAASLGNLAFLLKTTGDLAAARPLYEESLEITLAALGPRHPETAITLNNTARFHHAAGDYAAARPLYERALAINREVNGPRHRSTGTGLTNLGIMLVETGDHAAARPLLERALEIRRETDGPRHPNTAFALNNLALAVRAAGDLAAAKALVEQALEIDRAVLGPRHPETAVDLANLAALLQATGDLEAARPLSEEALAIREETLGPRHPRTAESLNNLAVVLRAAGDPAAAGPLFRRCLAIRRETLGPRHPSTLNCLTNLGGSEADRGEPAAGRALVAEATRGALDRLDLAAAAQSAAGQRAYADDLRFHLDAHLSLTAGAAAEALRWKGIVLARRVGLARAGAAPELAADRDRLRAASGELASLLLRPPAADDRRAAWRAETAALAAGRDRLERALSRGSEAYRLAAEVTPADVSAALPAGAALVDVHAYAHYTPLPDRAEGRPRSRRRLAAFVYRPGAGPVRVDLGEEESVSAGVDAWRAAVSGGQPAEGVERIGRALRARVWDPLAPHLGGAAVVLVSPDGPLCRLPLAALPGDAAGSHLIEERAFAAVPVPRLLPLILSASPDPAAGPLLAVGGVDYDAAGGDTAPPPADAPAARPGVSVASRAAPRGAFGTFAPLAGTGPEAREVASTAGAAGSGGTVLLAADATEANVRRLAPAAGVLHLATHGYFAPPELRSRLAPRDLGEDGATGLMRTERDLAGYAPGLLSGLALAGANVGGTAADDGILTAEEVADLDLSRCRLAVLSACETGLGETAGGEGLLGLQRAFTAAGAGAVVAGLWAVPDAPTRSLMGRFHANRRRAGGSTLAALREAQLWVLNHPDEAGADRGLTFAAGDDPAGTRRDAAADRPARSHPRAWAGWSLSGDWR